MLYHREARLPIDTELMPGSSKDGDGDGGMDDYIQAMLQVRDDLKPEVMKNIKSAQEYQKQYYDKRHAPQVYIILCSLTFTQPHLSIFLCPVGAATWNGGIDGEHSTKTAKRWKAQRQVAWTLHY